MSQGETTTDHDTIRKWAEERGGRPTRVRGTEGRDGSGVLRFDFAEPDEKLEEIPWEEFFETFEDRELALLYQEKTADGHTSRFFKFVHRRESGGGGEGTGPGARGSDQQPGGPDGHRGAGKTRESKMADDTQHRGSVKDPEHDGRLKENREAGRTKSTTPASTARAHEGGKSSEDHGSDKSSGKSAGSGRSGGGQASGSGNQGSSGGGSDDLKSREYKDADGNVHHHTRTYQEQHAKK